MNLTKQNLEAAVKENIISQKQSEHLKELKNNQIQLLISISQMCFIILVELSQSER